MKPLLVIFIFFSLSGCTKEVPLEAKTTQKPNSFQHVWDVVSASVLKMLPQEKVSFGKLFSFGKDIILQDAKRTLDSRADLLAPFEKLAHPNGICFKGIWSIDTPNIYSGYFKQNTHGLIIARASSAMSNTKQGEVRAFGFAGKLFPSLDPTHISLSHSANFFLIDDLGGTKALHYTDVSLSNEPTVSATSAVLKNILYALKVARTFAQVDENPGIRQLYEISYLEEVDTAHIITPKWMKIEAYHPQKVDAKDFRDELNIKEGESLTFDIYVASVVVKGKKQWKRIGSIVLDDSVVSTACDKKLHFHHPKWKENLTHN